MGKSKNKEIYYIEKRRDWSPVAYDDSKPIAPTREVIREENGQIKIFNNETAAKDYIWENLTWSPSRQFQKARARETSFEGMGLAMLGAPLVLFGGPAAVLLTFNGGNSFSLIIIPIGLALVSTARSDNQ